MNHDQRWAGCAAAILAILALLQAQAPARADARIGKFNVSFAEGVFHRNGDFIIPGEVRGVSSDGDFRADRAFGNYQHNDVTLVGHVVLHQRAVPGHGPPQPPMTLTSQQLHVLGQPSIYTATGSVVVVQGDRQLHSDYLQLNDTTHDGVLRGHVVAQENDRVVNTSEVHYNTLTGALLVPSTLTGFSSDSDFRADRAVGNNRAGTFTMVGNVVVHRFNYGKANNSSEPLTLWCDKLDIANRPQVVYTATGHVKVTQGDRTLTGPVLKLNDTTHVADMTGGVHGEEKPDRTFDAAELLYNTQTEDFKALGGVKATFPFQRGAFGATPTPAPARHPASVPSASPSASPVVSPTPAGSPSPHPSATAAPSV
ncbi:MAG TPA: LPS export ABC transporter periplasmic protein LptC [Candidatus Acidoferrales bacterium]|nr:LPS export ABC transporter periplasmic protein LptC [Candidatus Acidoferrales bacterium]